jgi:hypothetical protein
MTNLEKQYVEKLKELVTILKLQLDIMTDNKNTDVPQYIRLFNLNIEVETEIAKFEQQITEEEKTVSDEEKELFHLCQYSEGVCVWCGHIMGIDDGGRIDPEADKQAFGSGWENIK